jgi:hypothetical protein
MHTRASQETNTARSVSVLSLGGVLLLIHFRGFNSDVLIIITIIDETALRASRVF